MGQKVWCTGVRFFAIPSALMDDGICKGLSGSACKLYLFLCHMANHKRAPIVEASNEEIMSTTGIRDHKSLKKARRELAVKGLVKCSVTADRVYAHTLLMPGTGAKFPVPIDRSGIRRYRRQSRQNGQPSRQYASRPRTKTARTQAPPTEDSKPQPEHRDPATPRMGESNSSALKNAVCRIHPGGQVWHLPDGTPRCVICHPNPAGLKREPTELKVPTGAELFGPRR